MKKLILGMILIIIPATIKPLHWPSDTMDNFYMQWIRNHPYTFTASVAALTTAAIMGYKSYLYYKNKVTTLQKTYKNNTAETLLSFLDKLAEKTTGSKIHLYQKFSQLVKNFYFTLLGEGDRYLFIQKAYNDKDESQNAMANPPLDEHLNDYKYLLILLYFEKNPAGAPQKFKPFEKNINNTKINLASRYKIHLMPEHNDVADIIYTLMQAQLKKYNIYQTNDTNLGGLIQQFKVMYANQWKETSEQNNQLPYIVIYPGDGKVVAQALLDRLYVLLEKFKGINIAPRFNAKVNDLIWIAQSDSDHKKTLKESEQFKNKIEPYYRFFELPNMVYYSSYFPTTGQENTPAGKHYAELYEYYRKEGLLDNTTHYLLHPKTREPIPGSIDQS